ncbi:hypothetical protein DFH08DRAFT_874942 [Mycena albidolilacea]|uniref:Uncharacterized protein n=1 Tax=Mycena albidolilacea TaxID=1033008 RepID=A0AAD7EPG2_9AGAR|nr:hypothetical protein DFH08DRAFT_874942 [Mycena albidolilacea]
MHINLPVLITPPPLAYLPERNEGVSCLLNTRGTAEHVVCHPTISDATVSPTPTLSHPTPVVSYTSAAMNNNCINTDISGIGVRSATYAQNLLSFLPAFWALLDGEVDENELATLETQSTTILLSAFALLFSTIIQAQSQGLDSFHATIVLNLSWMNNTNTFIYMLLLLHRKIWNTLPADWTARSVARALFGRKNRAGHPSADTETSQSPSTGHLPPTSPRASWSEWIPFDHVILIGALHLSFMGALGIWVWIHPGSFGISSSCPSGSVSLFANDIPIESGALRVFSLLVYGAVLLPYFNLVLPVALIFGPYFGYLLQKTGQETPKTTAVDEARKAATAWGVRVGLLVLFIINAFFIVDTELSIARNESRQEDQDGVWTFGQTLALILLLLPLRDAVENILQRSEKRVRRRLSLNEAVSNLKLYRDQVPWEIVEGWIKTIGDTAVDAHQLWLRRASAQNKIEIVRFLLGNGVTAKDQVYPRREDLSQIHDESNSPPPSAPLLTEKVFDANNEDVSMKTALHYAAEKGHKDIVSLLVQRGADVSGRGVRKWTPLHFAAKNGHEFIVNFLLQERSDVNATVEEGWTALHAAAQDGHAGIVRLLCEKGGNVNATVEEGWTALHAAAQDGHAGIVRLLCEKGGNVNAIGMFFLSYLGVQFLTTAAL